MATYEPIMDPFEVVVPSQQRDGRTRRPLFVASALAGAMLLVLAAVSYGGGGSQQHRTLAEAEASLAPVASKASAPAAAPSGRMASLVESIVAALEPKQALAATDQSIAATNSDHFFPDFIDNKYSEEPTGIFTGHRHGFKGGPLTFGRKTYYNVFDPHPEGIACTPGHKRDEQGKCVECPAGFWCPGEDDITDRGNLVNPCPSDTTSEPGADEPGDCYCNAGLFGIYSKGCRKCPAGYYCTGEGSDPNSGTIPTQCAPHSDSQDGAAVCRCVAGYYGVNPQDCKQCPANSFCLGGSKATACPANTVSQPGQIQCSCAAGYYGMDSTTGTGCMRCLVGSYCPGGPNLMQCPPGSTSRGGAKSMADCVCAAGYFGPDAAACTKCPVGSWCPGGNVKNACPAHTSSVEGSDEAKDCSCIPGWVGSAGSVCNVCPANKWCPGGAALNDCPAHTVSKQESDQVSDCTCGPGYVGTSPLSCQACAAGSYCIGGTSIQACPDQTTSPVASFKLEQCACKPGLFGDINNCAACPAGSVCPGGPTPVPCPANSAAPAGSSQINQCSCNAGYYGQSGGVCNTCPANSWCTGGLSVQQCGPDMVADQGSRDSGSCRCSQGTNYNLLQPRSAEAGATVCQRSNCFNMQSVCTMQAVCQNDGMCRGFTFQQQQGRLGRGCLLKGFANCLTAEADPNVQSSVKDNVGAYWVKNAQPGDSIDEMKAMGIPIPQCQAQSGPRVTFWQHCWPSPGNGWNTELPVGDYSQIGGTCDNNRGLCQITNCNLPAGDMSSMSIPAGIRVLIYDGPNFTGNSKWVYGPMAPGPNCMASWGGSRRGNWNDVVQSFRIEYA